MKLFLYEIWFSKPITKHWNFLLLTVDRSVYCLEKCIQYKFEIFQIIKPVGTISCHCEEEDCDCFDAQLDEFKEWSLFFENKSVENITANAKKDMMEDDEDSLEEGEEEGQKGSRIEKSEGEDLSEDQIECYFIPTKRKFNSSEDYKVLQKEFRTNYSMIKECSSRPLSMAHLYQFYELENTRIFYNREIRERTEYLQKPHQFTLPLLKEYSIKELQESLQKLNECYLSKNPQAMKELLATHPIVAKWIELSHDLQGRVLATYYKSEGQFSIESERLYRIKYLDCTTSATETTFRDKEGKQYNLVQYYGEKYQLPVYSSSFPIYVAQVAMGYHDVYQEENILETIVLNQRSAVIKEKEIYLIPELCQLKQEDYPENMYFVSKLLRKLSSEIAESFEHGNKLVKLCKNWNVEFGNLHLLRQAFIHKSAKNCIAHNEGLEFLGDAVLDMVAVHYLFYSYPLSSEGNLSNVKTEIVRNDSLEKMGQAKGLRELLLHTANDITAAIKLNANTLEAFLGAMFLDRGLVYTRDFIIREFELYERKLEVKHTFELLDRVSQSTHLIRAIDLTRILELEEKVQYFFKNKYLILEAMTHYNYKQFPFLSTLHVQQKFNYERLEFLGDTILKFVTAQHMFFTNESQDEGPMTIAKNNLVSSENILRGMRVRNFSFESHCFSSTPFESLPKKVPTDFFEALIGAVYIDTGGFTVYNEREWDVTGGLVHYFLFNEESMQIVKEKVRQSIEAAEEVENASTTSVLADATVKSLLQTYCQKNITGNPLPKYETSSHGEIQTAVCKILDVPYGQGQAKKKKEAEAIAAQQTLEYLKVYGVKKVD